MVRFEFHDLENIDGFFSGIIYICTERERYILEFGYDIEFGQLNLLNSTNLLYNSHFVEYSGEKIGEIRMNYEELILQEIRYRLNI